MRIIDNIKRLRQSKGWTHEDIAERMNMSPSNWNKIENGYIEVTLTKLEKLAEVFEIPVYQFLIDNSKPTDFHGFLSSPNEWMKISSEPITSSKDDVSKCKEELSTAQKKIIELQARLIEVFDKK